MADGLPKVDRAELRKRLLAEFERVVEEVLKLLETHPPKMTPAPAREDRTAGELNGS